VIWSSGHQKIKVLKPGGGSNPGLLDVLVVTFADYVSLEHQLIQKMFWLSALSVAGGAVLSETEPRLDK
jgi:hypothetical protein